MVVVVLVAEVVDVAVAVVDVLQLALHLLKRAYGISLCGYPFQLL